MSTEQPAACPLLKMITIRLIAEASQHQAETRQELVLSALASALSTLNASISTAWMVQAAPGDEPLLYELTQLREQPISINTAWEMTYALRNQPQIAMAEPTFTQ